MARERKDGRLSEIWQSCALSPPDLIFIAKDRISVPAHRSLLLPLSEKMRSLVEDSVCCGDAQVLVDGVSSSAIQAVIGLVYVGKYKTGQVSVEEIVEAGIALGLPFTKESLIEEKEKDKLDPNCGDGADLEKYSWTQRLGSVRIRVPLPQAVKAEANVAVIVKNRVFQVSVNGSPVIKRELSKEVQRELDFKLVEKKVALVVLHKVQKELWSSLFTKDPEINLQEVERRQKLEWEQLLPIYIECELKISREEGVMCRHEGCEKKFWGEKEREEHEKSVHQGQRLNCDHCEKSYSLSAKTSLMRHMLIEHNINVKCNKCGKQFDEFNNYMTHRREVCSKRYYYGKQSLMGNVEKLGEEKSDTSLKTLSGKSKCLFCGQITLSKHMSRHMREKHNSTHPNRPKDLDFNKDLVEAGLKPDPAKCPICDKKFKNVRSLPRHMKTAHEK